MLIPCQIHTITAGERMGSLWAVYMCMDADHAVQYVGVERLDKLFTLRDAQENSMWSSVFRGSETILELKVHTLSDSETEARNEMNAIFHKYQPPCNVRGYRIAFDAWQVICNETQETFPNARACALAHALTYSALMAHLKREVGHKSVKGRTYTRTAPQRPGRP